MATFAFTFLNGSVGNDTIHTVISKHSGTVGTVQTLLYEWGIIVDPPPKEFSYSLNYM